MVSRTKNQDQASTGPSEDQSGSEVVEATIDEGAANSKEIAEFRASLSNQPGLESMMDWCVEQSALSAEDQWSVMESEVARILAADDMAAALAESKPLSGKDFVGRPFRVNGFTLTPTDFAEGWPFYANINATIDRDGTTAVINCGGPKVIAALMAAHRNDAIPFYAMIKANQTKKGFTVLSLVMPGPA